MKCLLLISMLAVSLASESQRKDIHHRHTHTDGAAIGPSKVRVYRDVPLGAPPGSIEHQTQYWQETKEIKRNSPEPYYNGGESAASPLPSYTVNYGMGGQRKALFPRVRGLRYYSRLNKRGKNHKKLRKHKRKHHKRH